jgi:hypothetical protein
MDVKRWLWIGIFFLVLSRGAVLAESTDAKVMLPLRDYLSLVETAERLERQRAEELARQETPVAEVVSQRVSLAVGGSEAEVASDFEVLLQGKVLRPVLLPLAGFPEKIEIRDEAGRTGTAAVSALDGGGGVVLAAPQPGRYTVHVEGRAALGTGGGTGRLSLGRVAAPVASTEIDLPADLAWSSPGAVVVEEREQNGRRRVRLATARGADTVLDVRRKVDSAEAEKLIAQSVVLTILQLRPEGLRRHDVVLYEVRRGGLGSFTVELPPGLEIEQAGTDEGTVVPVVETGRLTVHRQRQLQGVGYLVLSSTPPALPAEGLSLDTVRPETEVRSRYLAISSAVAADVRPLPEASWSRVDTSDLPSALSEALTALDLAAAWRLAADGTGARLAVNALPAAPALDVLIRRRDTTTLLTVDGTLLVLDRFLVDSRSRAGAALDVALPAGGKLWSAKVDEQPVRPLERGGVVSVPLGFSGGTRAEVEVVSVLEKVLPPGRSELALDLPQVTAPVLLHRLRLLLPESASYRVRRADLRYAPVRARPSGRRRPATPPQDLDLEPPPARDPWTVLQKTPGVLTDRINVGGNESGQQRAYVGPGSLAGGYGNLHVTVTDEQGEPLPGATLALRKDDGVAVQVSDARGQAKITGLADGAYSLHVELEGFSTIEYPNIALNNGRNTVLEVTLASAVEDMITVSTETPLMDERRINTGATVSQTELEKIPAARDPHAIFKEEVEGLQQGLVGGVKPLPVSIPETGKAFAFSGVLPPSRITLEVEVKAKR